MIIDPAIPSDWKFFKVERVFRGTKYIIEVDNSAGVDHGVGSVLVDGSAIDGNIIPVSKNKVCNVKVKMGKKQ